PRHRRCPTLPYTTLFRSARGRNIGDSSCQRDIDTDGLSIRVHAAADDDTCSTGAHQVQCGGVIHHATGNDWNFQRADEFLEVQRLATGRNVLCREQGALNEQQLCTSSDGNRRNLAGILWRDTYCHGHGGITHLGDTL